MESNDRIEYCTCSEVTCVYTETNDGGQWDVCNKCNKPIEDSYELTDPNYSEY